jgi:hypothetical protein
MLESEMRWLGMAIQGTRRPAICSPGARVFPLGVPWVFSRGKRNILLGVQQNPLIITMFLIHVGKQGMNRQSKRLPKILVLLAFGVLSAISASAATLTPHSVVYAYTRGQYNFVQEDSGNRPQEIIVLSSYTKADGRMLLTFSLPGGGTNDLYMTDVNNVTI